MIEKQRQLIALLGEKRQAVISHAVTKGLNPDAPMRDSGVEWLGEVPEHWIVMTVRNMLRAGDLETQDGNLGELHPVAADYVDEGVPFLMANNVRHGRVSLNPCNFLTRQHADRLRIGIARKGDLLLTHKGTVGEVAMVSDSVGDDYWMLTPQVTYYRWSNEKYVTKFFYFLFQSLPILEQLWAIGGKQSTRVYVGLVAQKELLLAVPPVAEQLAINEHLGAILDKLDAISDKADAKIDLLQERRTALISASVTGKIDVRGWKRPSFRSFQKRKRNGGRMNADDLSRWAIAPVPLQLRCSTTGAIARRLNFRKTGTIAQRLICGVQNGNR